MKGKKILLLAVMLLVTISFTGCSAKSQLVGKWQLTKSIVDGEQTYDYMSDDFVIYNEYTKDGQLLYEYSESDEDYLSRTIGTYSIEGDVIYYTQEYVQEDGEEMKPAMEVYGDLYDEEDLKNHWTFSIENNELIEKSFNYAGEEIISYYTKVD